MFKKLVEINKKPKPFEFYTASELWTNEHTSKKMLEYHLNENIDAASRNIKFINSSVLWIIDHFKLNSNSNIIDFGCGPGLYTTRFAKHGINVTGIDFSKNSLHYAKKIAQKKNLNVNYIHKNYLDFQTEDKYDLITMIMCDFTALNPSQRKTMLNKFKSILKPNGSILLDVFSLAAFNLKEEHSFYELNQLNNFWSDKDYYCFVNIYKYNEEKVSLDKYSIFEESGEKTVYNWLQYYSVNDLKKEFSNCGIKITEVYKDVTGNEYDPHHTEFAVIGKKI